MELSNFVSLFGLIAFIFLGYLFSTDRKAVNWHVVIWGVGLQFLVAWFLFVFPAGIKLFLFLNDLVVKLLDSATAGANFVFGPLAFPPGKEGSIGFVLAFQAFPTIIFFSALMSILYYLNIMPRLIKGFAFFFTKLMKVSGAESLCTASNIFVGVEAVLTVKPYLKDMTRSELCTVLTAGMATVASNIMVVYVFALHQYFPTIAGHLISASLLSAPAALVMSKVLLPETSVPKTLGENVEPYIEREDSLFEAIINGANAGLKLIMGITALLIAVLGLMALLDQMFGFLGGWVNTALNINFEWSFKNLLGFVFYPFTLLIGIPLADAPVLSRIIGERLVVTELTAYQDLATIMSQNILTDPRSAVITAYALCGFAHVASLAIFIGGIAAIVPEKTRELSQVGFRALCAATLACFLTACVAGVFFTRGSVLLGY